MNVFLLPHASYRCCFRYEDPIRIDNGRTHDPRLEACPGKFLFSFCICGLDSGFKAGWPTNCLYFSMYSDSEINIPFVPSHHYSDYHAGYITAVTIEAAFFNSTKHITDWVRWVRACLALHHYHTLSHHLLTSCLLVPLLYDLLCVWRQWSRLDGDLWPLLNSLFFLVPFM